MTNWLIIIGLSITNKGGLLKLDWSKETWIALSYNLAAVLCFEQYHAQDVCFDIIL